MRKPKQTEAEALAVAMCSRNQPAPEEAGALARDLALRTDHHDITLVLLLCHSLTYEDDFTRRENMMREIELACAPFLPDYDAMLRGVLARELAALRKGGAK